MLLEKLKNLGSDSLTASSPAAPPGKPPTIKSIYQSRHNFGVNFGSLFVQESFIFGKFFPDGSNTEFSGVSSYIKEHGLDQTRKDLEDHWNGFVTDDDWKWLASVGVTAVRIPIGYWHVNGGLYTKGTPFEKISAVYKNAWPILKNIIKKASEYQIGVLIDLHALPGGANCSEHSGIENKSAQFWDNSKYQKATFTLLEFITDDVKSFDNIVGLQIVNESEFSNDAKAQQRYYAHALKKIRGVDPGIPVIISDGWWPDQWVKWLQKEEKSGVGSSGIVIDTHVYRCFSEDDKKKSPEQIIQDLDKDVLTNLSGSADFIVGEYSCVLDGASYQSAQHDRNELVKQYGQKQSEIFSNRANAGSYFWTLKFEHGDGGEWGFIPQVNNGAIPKHPTSANIPSDDKFNEIVEQEYKAHSQYWDQENPKEKWEHWRYREGFTTAWADSIEFAKFNGSVIGRTTAWRNARLQEHVSARGDSGFVWEWEQGFDKALAIFKQVAF